MPRLTCRLVPLPELSDAAARPSHLVVFAGEGVSLGERARAALGPGGEAALREAATLERWTGRARSALSLVVADERGARRVTAVGLGKDAEREKLDAVLLGGAVAGAVRAGAAGVLLDLPGAAPSPEFAADLTLGMTLRAYEFDRYKTRRDDENGGENGEGGAPDSSPGEAMLADAAPGAPTAAEVTPRQAPPTKSRKTTAAKDTSGRDVKRADAAPPRDVDIQLGVADVAAVRKARRRADALSAGVVLARDLVNEPPNVLFPEEFADRAAKLSSLGVEIEVLDEKAMRKLGMRALLGVGQGSARESRVVLMQWRGAKDRNAAPLAFVGKGVTFDTGGISIKPSAGMEDMKGDMAGAACVVGLMHALAARKARVNAVGAIGLVENMPDGKAQRPGDIVTAMSGQTIEIINTDAEGRLVLADVLHHVRERFKPAAMIDLATLTGAILVALGSEHAGLFSNNDELAERLTKAGLATGEKVWRMPLGRAYDKMIDSKFADIKNTGGRHAGSITAAQFLGRFVGDTPWAHLDIAGTGMGSPSTDISKGWASGFGVRLLDRLVSEFYEDGR